jgi:hypothetical protein
MGFDWYAQYFSATKTIPRFSLLSLYFSFPSSFPFPHQTQNVQSYLLSNYGGAILKAEPVARLAASAAGTF